jgi:phospholipase D1/2
LGDAEDDEDDYHDEEDDDDRRVIAFVGGLDLCDGRWDTAQHSLYRTLQKEHKFDFHQVWPVDQSHGPREPWHDIHSKLEGPITRDVLCNFEERWKKQASNLANSLLPIHNSPDFITEEEEEVYNEHSFHSWSSQFFRSINYFSASRTRVAPDTNYREADISAAYVHHIRRAKSFIYIENQYFLGSSHCWDKNDNNSIKCRNLVPIELTNKIIASIEQKKPFAVYILVPMYPEGIPEGSATQEILCWQFRTISMMYSKIHQCLEKQGLLGQRSPQDYLSFYCLGNRETVEGSQHNPSAPKPDPKVSRALILNQTRRFMIYVHAKMMIVDDEYIILGSANLNQRSLSGGRDTEITVGSFQPHHIAKYIHNEKDVQVVQLPRGEVHAFRMSLWAEHTGRVLPIYLQPSEVECVRAVNKIALRNWDAYCGEKIVDMARGNGDPYDPNVEHLSHLMKYPINVGPDGKAFVPKSHSVFPDTQASVSGVDSSFLPNLLTL